MKKKFIGPANPGVDPDSGKWSDDLGHEVNVRGRYLGRVKVGDVLDVPEELCSDSMAADGKTVLEAAPVWSGELWEDVKPSAKAAAKTKGED